MNTWLTKSKAFSKTTFERKPLIFKIFLTSNISKEDKSFLILFPNALKISLLSVLRRNVGLQFLINVLSLSY